MEAKKEQDVFDFGAAVAFENLDVDLHSCCNHYSTVFSPEFGPVHLRYEARSFSTFMSQRTIAT